TLFEPLIVTSTLPEALGLQEFCRLTSAAGAADRLMSRTIAELPRRLPEKHRAFDRPEKVIRALSDKDVRARRLVRADKIVGIPPRQRASALKNPLGPEDASGGRSTFGGWRCAGAGGSRRKPCARRELQAERLA